MDTKKYKAIASELEWEDDGDGSWIAYNYFGGPFEIDILVYSGYSAQRNNMSGDNEGKTLATLEEAKAYCQKLTQSDVDTLMLDVDIETIS